MKIIGVIMTYNCESFVQNAIDQIPKDKFDEIICTDDGSTDNTIEVIKKNNIKFIENNHLGYGMNLYAGMKKAFELGATHVVELHGDSQYDFSYVKEMKSKFSDGFDLVLGNRFYDYRQPLNDGMPLYIYMGNIFLTLLGRIGLGIKNNDLFQGFRGYSKNLYNQINTSNFNQDYRFSYEIIAQSYYLNLNISSVPTKCNYKGDHTTMPLKRAIPCILHTLKIGLHYRLAKLGLKFSIFKI
jgi:glycosyltransferase involved in cell wall biosynthesis